MKKATDNGIKDVMFNYGLILMNGDGVKADPNESAKYFKMSADKGNTDAMKIMAGLIMQDKNKEEAAKFLFLASNYGDDVSSFLYKHLFKNK